MRKSLNERFTNIADAISEGLGKWWFSILSLVTLIIWIFYGIYIIGGSDWFTSTTWNFPLNTLTTVGEWFIGAFIAAAANRVEKRNRELQQTQTLLLKHVENLVDDEDKELKQIEQEMKQEQRTQDIVKHLDQQDTELVKQTEMLLKLLERRYHP